MNFVFLKLNHTNFHDFTFNLNLAKIIFRDVSSLTFTLNLLNT